MRAIDHKKKHYILQYLMLLLLHYLYVCISFRLQQLVKRQQKTETVWSKKTGPVVFHNIFLLFLFFLSHLPPFLLVSCLLNTKKSKNVENGFLLFFLFTFNGLKQGKKRRKKNEMIVESQSVFT